MLYFLPPLAALIPRVVIISYYSKSSSALSSRISRAMPQPSLAAYSSFLPSDAIFKCHLNFPVHNSVPHKRGSTACDTPSHLSQRSTDTQVPHPTWEPPGSFPAPSKVLKRLIISTETKYSYILLPLTHKTTFGVYRGTPNSTISSPKNPKKPFSTTELFLI